MTAATERLFAILSGILVASIATGVITLVDSDADVRIDAVEVAAEGPTEEPAADPTTTPDGGGDDPPTATPEATPTPTAAPQPAPSQPARPARDTDAPTPSQLGWGRGIVDQGGDARHGQEVRDVTWTPVGFVAVGDELRRGEVAAVWTSPDGGEWTRVRHVEAVFGEPRNLRMRAVTTAGDGRIVAVGSEDDSSSTKAAVWTSTDGQIWTRIPDDPGTFDALLIWMNDVAASDTRIVAVGTDVETRQAAMWFSDDGTTWTRISADPTVFGGGRVSAESVLALPDGSFVAAGRDSLSGRGAVWLSPDGTTWERVSDDTAPAGNGEVRIEALTRAAGGLLVAVGSDETDEPEAAIWVSLDGRVWDPVPTDDRGPTGQTSTIHDVITTADGLVAVGEVDRLPAMWTSNIGRTWTLLDDDVVLFDADEIPVALAGDIDTTVAVGAFHSVDDAGDPDIDMSAWVSER